MTYDVRGMTFLTVHQNWLQERRSSHVPLTAPGAVVSAHVEEDKKGEPEVSLPQHGDKENSPTAVSSVTLASHTCMNVFLAYIA
jgi:hypothetical protein